MTFDYLQYPHLPSNAITVLWSVDFWDRALSGIATYQEKQYWFEMVEESDITFDGFWRRFVLIELTVEEIADEIYWHNLFMEKVGMYPNPKPKSVHHEFYERYKQRTTPNYLHNHTIIGWFEN